MGVPDWFSERKRYKNAMTLADIAISDEPWVSIGSDSMEGRDQRKLISDIEKGTLRKKNELEKVGCDKAPAKRGKAKT